MTHSVRSTCNQRPAEAATLDEWHADRGDGTYRNPVLFADYSDPDAIRVGDDYWLTSSSFNHVPGLPILHSRDLVNWTLVNHALPCLVPDQHFSEPRHGAGVWAPALRHHAGKFRIFYPDPDFGLYVVTASDPRGRWSAPVMVKAGKGLIDPCPFWDEDGTGYLVHGWAKSRAGIKNRVTLHRLRADNASVADAGEVIIDGDTIEGWHTIEGPKLYKRAGYYYVFVPAGGVRDGYQGVFRARNLRGPYEHRIVLAQGGTAINGPHQGAWVETATGENWFLHFQELPAFGRVVHLQPMQWRHNWPVIGEAGEGAQCGEPVSVHRKPSVTGPGSSVLAKEADAATDLSEWQWQANPKPGWLTTSADQATWRLACVARPAPDTLWQAPNLLLRKFCGPAFSAQALLKLVAGDAGDRAGLVVFGHDYAWLGLTRGHGSVRLGLHVCTGAHEAGAEHETAIVDGGIEAVHVRVDVDEAARCQFRYSVDGRRFVDIGAPFQAKSSYWVGAKFGFFASAQAPHAAKATLGHAEVSGFAVRVGAGIEA
jgi:beta-xylosidase